MATVTQILADIDLRYRNTFSTSQKLVWLNEEQRDLFDILEIDSEPYAFATVEGENFYPFPDEFDITKIKTVTMQIDNTNFTEIDFKRNDDRQYGTGIWYSIVSNAFYLNYPNSVPDGRMVYIYCDSEPVEVTLDNLNLSPSTPVRYQEILKLGVLKRIAAARKDVVFQNNYDNEREQKIIDDMWAKKLSEPEWTQPNDVIPRAGNWWAYGNYRNTYWGG